MKFPKIQIKLDPASVVGAVCLLVIVGMMFGVIPSPGDNGDRENGDDWDGTPPTGPAPINWDDVWDDFWDAMGGDDDDTPPGDDAPPAPPDDGGEGCDPEPDPEDPECGPVDLVLPTNDDCASSVVDGIAFTEWAITWWINWNAETGEGYEHAPWYCGNPPGEPHGCDSNTDCDEVYSPDGYPMPYCWTGSGGDVCCSHYI